MNFLLILFLFFQICSINSYVISMMVSSVAVILTSYFRCSYFECCAQTKTQKSNYIKFKVNDELENMLKNKIIGQHIMQEILPKAIHEHRNNDNPSNPLVISLHGSTGTGKTYTCEIIANALYTKGFNSIFVKKITPGKFFPDENKINQYKEDLIKLLDDQIAICPRSLIIIEEIDKMNSELIETLSSYINDKNYLQNSLIYIFTSNTGSNKIIEFAYKYYLSGKNRNDMTFNELEKIIKEASFNDDSGLKYNSMISYHLISHYVPYLPLDRKHVEFCIKNYLNLNFKDKFINTYYNLKDLNQLIDKVFDNLEWWPDNLKLFSTSGCKQVWNKIDILI